MAPAGWRQTVPDLQAVADALRKYGPPVASWVLPFILIVYLGLNGGGYETIVRDEAGIVVWWFVLLGVTIGLLPTTGLGRAGWAAVALLIGFAAWTGIAIAWSPSSEASFTEFARVATYLGVFALGLTARQPGDMARVVNGLAAGMAVIAVVALLSRLDPSLVAGDETSQLLASTQNRLSYPLGYWNGLAALMAMAIPLLLFIAIRGRSVAACALAAGALPAVALADFLTLSRGGAIEAGVALVVFLALAPRRMAALPSMINAAAGSAVLIIGASQRHALSDGLATQLAHQQGNELLTMALLVCGVTALIQVAIALAARHRIGPRVTVSPRTAATTAILAGLAALVLFVGVGGPHYLSQRWDDFKTPNGAGGGVARFDSASGSGRYQTWSSAQDAGVTHPWRGIGPGTFESWWAENRSVPLFVRDAHSLYMETFGELGVIGLSLIAVFVLTTLGVGGNRASRGHPSRRWPYAAGTASAAVFAVGAGIDWAWELAVLPVAFMVLAGGLLASRRYNPPRPRERFVSRAALGVCGIVATAAITISLLGAESIRNSQADTRSGDLTSALDEAKHAHDLQPYASTPLLQQALVLELLRDYPAAADAARSATRADSQNWRPWLVLSRLEAVGGRTQRSIDAYKKAKSLNPRSPLFTSG